MPHLLDLLGAGGVARHLARGIGRQGVEDHEGDDADAEQDQNREHEPADQISNHQCRPRKVGSRISRRASPMRLKERASSAMQPPGKKTSQGAVSK